jgi:hypothetical protein
METKISIQLAPVQAKLALASGLTAKQPAPAAKRNRPDQVKLLAHFQ